MSAATNIPVSAESPIASVPRDDSAEFRARMGKISRHSAVYFFGTIFSAGAGYLFKIYIAHALGASALGLYTLGMSVVGFLGVFNAVGLPSAAARFVSEYSSRHDYVSLRGFLRTGMMLLGAGNLLLGVVFVLAAPWVAVRFYHAPALATYSASFALIMLLGVLTNFLGQSMAGFREIARRTAITQFTATTATIGIAVVLIRLGFGLQGYLVAQIVSSALVLTLLAISIWRLIPAAARTQGSPARIEAKVVSFSATAFGIGLMHFALAQSDKVVLGCYLRPKDVGVYAMAVSVAAFVPIALQSVNQIFSPMIAELHAAGNYALLRKLYVALTKWTIIATLPLAFCVISYAQTLMNFFGKGFEAGTTVLVIAVLGQLVNCAVGSVGYLLLMSGNQVQLMKIEAVNAALVIGLSLLLVPRFGIVGASLASTATVIGTNVWGLVSVRRRMGLFPYDRSYWNLALPAAACCLALAALRHVFAAEVSSWHVVPLASVCAYASFFTVVFARGVQQQDRMLASLAWARIRGTFVRNGG